MKNSLRSALLLLILAMNIAPSTAAPTGKALEIIKHLNMEKIPAEGPWFILTYRSDDALSAGTLPARYAQGPHVAGSAIYTVQTREDFSAMHLLQTDEIWHFYGGDPLEVLLLYPDGHGETAVVGPDVLHGQHPQFVVPRGVWQGSRPLGTNAAAYTFFGNTLAPGFEYADFAIGYRDELQKQYPKFAAKIAEFTRDEFATRPAAEKTAASTPTPATVAPSAPAVFGPADVKAIEVGAGVVLHELVGREALAKSDQYSIALFTLAPGHATITSYNQVSEEVFLVTSGHGEITLDAATEKIGPGSTVVVKPKVRHALKATTGEALEFYAISVPAYSHEDFVVAPAK
jgi:predicted cupin superfamily sugar epimerase/mannose-6-phosphate isomerase-like protein (cupin superfamily)